MMLLAFTSLAWYFAICIGYAILLRDLEGAVRDLVVGLAAPCLLIVVVMAVLLGISFGGLLHDGHIISAQVIHDSYPIKDFLLTWHLGVLPHVEHFPLSGPYLQDENFQKVTKQATIQHIIRYLPQG
jgi:hypothetical protein